MRALLYITLLALSAGACATAHSYTIEDDIYYVPGKKTPFIKEAREITGEEYPQKSYVDDTYAYEAHRSEGSSVAPKDFTEKQQQRLYTRSGAVENTDINALTRQAQSTLANRRYVNETIYENTGYWIGGYKGNERDLDEIQRIINMYPNGFAFFNGNGYDIAMNLSFDMDWNVYTDNGRYWWFPSYTNIELYSSLLFGTYPKYIWTVVWDNPRFDNRAFNSTFNNRFNWGLSFGWGGPGWSFGLGWNSSWYDPWYRGWYDPWYDPWCRPWHPHWCNPWYGYHRYDHYHPNWNRPARPIHPLAGQRPNYGGGVSGIRPNGQSGRFPTRPSAGRRPSSSGVIRPNSGSHFGTSGYPNNGNTIRPNNSTIRPGNNTGSMGRPNTATQSTTRPNTGNVLRPGTGNRNNSTVRPGTTTRPTTTRRPNTTTRPQTTTRPATQTNSRPNTTTRSTTTRRPTTTRSDNSHVRPNNSYRPTYNNNNSNHETYTPRRSSTGSGTNSGGNRPVRRR